MIRGEARLDPADGWTNASVAAAPTSHAKASPYAWYVVAVLMIAYLIAFLDRQILSLLVAPLKRDLLLTDTQVSLLQGFAFAIFYTLLGLPLGRLADAANRRNLILVGMALWSLATAFCGVARSFPQLFLARVGVGVGEATLSPSAYAMIAEYFPPRQLSLAMSLYSLGAFLGLGLALIAGGALVSAAAAIGSVTFFGMRFVDWQLIFLLLGAIGIIGILLMLTVREPPRHPAALSEPISFAATCRHMRCHSGAFASLLGGFTCFILMSSAMIAWAPTILIRVYGWAPPQAGLWIGVVALLGSGTGVLLGGVSSDRLIARGVRAAPVMIGVVGALGLALAMVALAAAVSGHGVVLALGLAYFFLSLPLGIAPAAVQMIALPTMRSQLSAVYLSVTNLIGLGFGPTIVALCTDVVLGSEMRVQGALAMTGMAVMPLSAVMLFCGRKAFARTVEQLATMEDR